MSRQFAFSPRITLFSLLCLSAFVSLGFWQLDREIEKRALIARESSQATATPDRLAADGSPPVAGQRVRLQGEFDTEVVLLLDNRVLDGTVGFEMHQLFHDESGVSVLVNRGFVPMGRTRADLPDLPLAPTGNVALNGRIHYPSAPYLLPPDDGMYEQFPVIVQFPNGAQLDQVMAEHRILPFVVRSADNAVGALPRYWPATIMQPEKHRAYAVQWFAMALAVLLMWLAVSFPTSKTRGSEERNE